MLPYTKRVELARHGIALSWSENLNRQGYTKGFGFIPMTEEICQEQYLRVDFPVITQEEVDKLIVEHFGYFIYDPILGEVHEKKQRILEDVTILFNEQLLVIPQVAPVENHATEMIVAATHGIVNNELLRIIDRGSHSYTLSNGESYAKDNTRNEHPVIWVRMIATNYDDIEYSTW